MPHLDQQSQYGHVNQNQNGLNIDWGNTNPVQVQSMVGGPGHQENLRGTGVNINALHGINTELAAERLLASQMQGQMFNQHSNIPAGVNHNPVGSNVMNTQPPNGINKYNYNREMGGFLVPYKSEAQPQPQQISDPVKELGDKRLMSTQEYIYNMENPH
jgi:hypothetical protein